MKYYLIGIKGNGMTSLSLLLKQNGYEVEGEDVSNYIQTEEKLKENNIKIYQLGTYKNIEADIFIVGHTFENDIDLSNKIVINYSTFLSFFLRERGLVSVCGSHGKTTMVGLLAHLLNASYLKGDGDSNYIDESNKFILESCEYKDHFLLYNPEEVILLNIDYDHSDYFKSYKQYLSSFKKFINKGKRSFVPYKLKRYFKNSITIGKEKNADFYYKNIKINSSFLEFDIYSFKEFSLHIKTKLKGIQFIELITFCYAYCYINDLEFDINKLDTFVLAKRRFNIINFENYNIIDDYAHHPSQISMHYKNINYLFKDYKYIAIFEPDRYSRLNTFKKQFVKELKKFDKVYILPLPEMSENVGKSNMIIKNKKFKFINSINEIDTNVKEKTIYSFMSSKEMKENIEELHKLMEK